MEFREVVQKVIESIPFDKMFDTNFVINRLIKNHSDEYINFVSTFINPEDSTLSEHENVGLQIAEFEGQLIEQHANKSWSENIHGRPNECALWKRISIADGYREKVT